MPINNQAIASLTASLVSFWGLVAIAQIKSPVLAVPAPQILAQATTRTAINRPILKVGSQGMAVSELQAALKLLGYYADAVDGVYSESTAIAVSRFQQAAGLNPDGIVSPETWERLFPPTPTASSNVVATNSATDAKPTPAPISPSPTRSTSNSVDLPVLRLGMRGAAVTKLQQRLQAIGLLKDAVDGVFGSNTEDAVEAAQRRYGLNPDGVVGSATWKNLLR